MIHVTRLFSSLHAVSLEFSEYIYIQLSFIVVSKCSGRGSLRMTSDLVFFPHKQHAEKHDLWCIRVYACTIVFKTNDQVAHILTHLNYSFLPAFYIQ